MSQSVHIDNAKLAEAIHTIQQFVATSNFTIANVVADIGGTPLANCNQADFAKFGRVTLNLTIDLRQPNDDGSQKQIPNHLVSSSLFGADPSAYYNDVVANIINDITQDKAFNDLLNEFVNQTVDDVLKAAALRASQTGAPPQNVEFGNYDKALREALEAVKKDPAFRSKFNSHVSHVMLATMQNPEFLARSKLVIARQLETLATSKALAADDDYALAANNYLQLQLDDIIRNIQLSIIKDSQAHKLDHLSSHQAEQYLRSKISEQKEILRSRLLVNPEQQFSNLNELRASLVNVIGNDEKLHDIVNAYFHSKINYLAENNKQPGELVAALQHDSSASKLFGQEVNEYIAQRIMMHLQNSQLLVKSQMIVEK